MASEAITASKGPVSENLADRSCGTNVTSEATSSQASSTDDKPEDEAKKPEAKEPTPIPTLPPNPNSPDEIKTLDQFPTEVLLMILAWIPRPTDLKSLCLTNKTLRRLATPKLYRSMNLFIGGPKDKKITDMLRRGNPGLTEIREIALRLEKFALRPKRTTYSDDSSSDDDEGKDETTIPARQAQITVRFLLTMLPEDQLEVFSWQNWEPFDVENFELLCETQKKLRCIEMGPMDQDLDPILEKRAKMFEKMDRISTIDVYPDTVDRLHAAQRLLKAKPDVEQLTVSTGFEYHEAQDIPPDLNDSSTRPGLLTRTLFGHMMPFESCTPYQKLTSLDLDAIELRYCADTWCKFIQFSRLEKLEVRNCAGAEQLWAQISKPHQRPMRLKTLRWMDDSNSSQPALEAFDNFLESINSLETLHIYVSGPDRLPKVSSIVPHKKNLMSLSVHSQQLRGTIYTYSEADFDLLCRECTELRQLAVNFPKTTAESATPSPEWTAFVDSVNTKLPHLRTLNIRRWPHFRELSLAPRSRVLPNLRLYEHYLQRLSQSIFEASDREAAVATPAPWGHGHRSALSVIAWGANGHSRHDCTDKYKIKQIPFVRGRKIGPFGESELLAVQSIWRLVQFVEPESDVLNHSLYDMHEVSDLSTVRRPLEQSLQSDLEMI